ncbi:MAG TPA: TetR/AcrR family transcriptional regulator [Stellaceae bacterium]|nr:TetR/AcrR family transcriptional regulator [Stellaceae bacterium]
MTALEGTASAPARRGGRPTRSGAAEIGERILEVATRLFLSDGFGATSIEAVAQACRISKRTFYHRFRDKPDLFRAVVRRLIADWARPFEARVEAGGALEDVLGGAARQILKAALSPEALQLYRLLIAEAPRFPELARIIAESSAAANGRLADLFVAEHERGTLALDPRHAAEQFTNLVIAGPRRRALGLGPVLGTAELETWAAGAVRLFLDGARQAAV